MFSRPPSVPLFLQTVRLASAALKERDKFTDILVDVKPFLFASAL